VIKRSIASLGSSPTNEEIVSIEDANRTKYNTADQTLWVFADGKSSKDTDTSVILGTAYRNTSLLFMNKRFMV
jgi:hypothetical protein